MPDDNEKPDECEGCEYPTPNLTFYEAEYAFNGYPMRRAAWLCELCAPTACGQASVSVTHNEYTELKPITSTICYVGNLLLAKMATLARINAENNADTLRAILAELRKRP